MARARQGDWDPLNDHSPQELASMAILVFGVLVVGYLVWNSAYIVKEYEQAVVLRFGKYHTTQPNGLRFKIPFVDRSVLVDTSERSMRLPWGYDERDQDQAVIGSDRVDEDALILTGDLYAAVVEWNVFWRVSEPEKFIFSFDEQQVRDALLAIARSTMHRVVGDYSADETLTSKREEITQAALTEMREVMERFDAGIEISELQLQRVTPPDVVKPAFDDVNASIQKKDQLINEATRERFRMINEAEAASDKVVREAEGYAERRLAEAEGEIDALLSKYESYRLAPDITRRRLYLEAMEEVFKQGGKVTVVDSDLKGILPMLQLNANQPTVSPR